jgi:hypothetical protein
MAAMLLVACCMCIHPVHDNASIVYVHVQLCALIVLCLFCSLLTGWQCQAMHELLQCCPSWLELLLLLLLWYQPRQQLTAGQVHTVLTVPWLALRSMLSVPQA